MNERIDALLLRVMKLEKKVAELEKRPDQGYSTDLEIEETGAVGSARSSMKEESDGHYKHI